MYKRNVLKYAMPTLVGLLFLSESFAANIRGIIVDGRTGEPLIAATVLVTGVSDSTQRRYVTTGNDGSFLMRNLAAQNSYRVEFNYLGYGKVTQILNLGTEDKDFGRIRLRPDAVDLEEVQVTGTAVRASQRGDTTDFNADAYKVTQDATTEDLLKKLPGVTIEGNTIKTQGEEVRRVLVDGKPFFVYVPSIAIKNLPAEVIARIEVYNRLSEQAQLTGLDDGEGERTINIVTRPNRRIGQFGRIYAGFGYDDKQDKIRYSAGGNLNLFNQSRRISIVGMTNNINQQNFAAEDMANMSSGGGGGGRGGRGGGGYMGANSGVATTNALGINYSETFGTKLDLSGSYFINAMDNENISASERDYVSGRNEGSHRSQNQSSTSTSYNHRLNMKIDYKFNDRTSLLFQPAIRFTSSNSNRKSETLMSTISTDTLSFSNNSSGSDQTRFNMNSELLLRHKFLQPGRTISLSVRVGANNSTTESRQYVETARSDSTTIRDQESENPIDNWSMRSRLLYTEPLGKRGLLELSYNLTMEPSKSNRHTYNIIDSLGERFRDSIPDALYSNIYSNDYTKHSGGLSYRMLTEKLNAMVGLDFEYADLNGHQTMPVKPDVNTSFNMLLPRAQVEYSFTKQKRLRAFYRTSTNAPSVTQLQSVLDNSDELRLQSGNPNLKQTFRQMMFVNYNQTSLDKGVTFFARLGGTTTMDGITSYTITNTSRDTVFTDENTGNEIELPKGSQYTTYRNVNGYYGLSSSATLGVPIGFMRSNLNLTAELNFENQPGFVDGEKNTARTIMPIGGATLSSNISEKIDFTLSYRARYENVKNTLANNDNNNYFRHTANFSGTWVTWQDITLRGTATYEQDRRLSTDYNQEFLRIDASLGKKFLKSKNAELRLSVFDLLNQAKNYNRNVTAEYIEDSRSNILTRYFMLPFVYSLRNFRGQQPPRENAQEGEGERRRREGGGGGGRMRDGGGGGRGGGFPY
jgi:hypothetical protein